MLTPTQFQMELVFIALLGFFGGIAIIRVTTSTVEKWIRILWRMEAKIDLLLKSAGIEFDPYRHLPPEVLDAMARGERIRAIKCYREASGAGLKDAMTLIDEAQRRAGRAR